MRHGGIVNKTIIFSFIISLSTESAHTWAETVWMKELHNSKEATQSTSPKSHGGYKILRATVVVEEQGQYWNNVRSSFTKQQGFVNIY